MSDGAEIFEVPANAERKSWLGRSVPRKEDRRLVEGLGTFSDDVWRHRMGYAHFVRSPHAHAKIKGTDTSRAEALRGVYATLTSDEVAEQQQFFTQVAPDPGGSIKDYGLAYPKVRYQGEPVAVVLAESRELARDAAELIEVEYEPLPLVTEAHESAQPDAPLIHREVGTNVAWHGVFRYGDIDWALEQADHVVEIDRAHFHRYSSTPLECNVAVVNWDPGSGIVEVHSNHQAPPIAAIQMAPALGVPHSKLRFITGDIGGAFGVKMITYTYLTVLALLSRKAGRPAKWTETRSEHHIAGGHGNERTFLDTKVAVQRDGEILGFKTAAFDDAGAYLRYEPLGAVIWAQVLCGNYRFKHVTVDYTEVITNKCPTCPNRGYSRLQHMFLIERIVDLVGRELGIDPVEIRKRNYIKPEEYPYTTPNGCIYDSGDLPASLDQALELVDIDRWRTRQRELLGTGKRIGIGIGSTLDSGTNNFGQARIINRDIPFSGNGEAANVKLDLGGEVHVALGSVPQGQGHETPAAQVAAEILGLDPDRVAVAAGQDTDRNVYVTLSGTYASQFAVTGLGAVKGAAEKLRGEILMLASAVLRAEPDELELRDGIVFIPGEDQRREITFAGLANLVYQNSAALPSDLEDEVTLNCRYVYRPPFEIPDRETKTGNLTLTYATAIHVAVVEIDEETGQLEIVDYAAVDDCGKRINPMIVEGMVHGGIAHGVGAVLHENLVYDDQGQLLAANFLDYHVPTALDLPSLRTGHIESPSPFTPHGAKGMGEGGGGSVVAMVAAIQDAVAPEGAKVLESHLGMERIHRLLRGQLDAGVRVVSR